MKGQIRSTIFILGLLVGAYLLLAVVFIWPPAGMIYVGSSLYSCAAALKSIENAKNDYACDKGLEKGTMVTLSELENYCGHPLPRCPVGGVYQLNRIGEKPTCSLAGTSGPAPKKTLVWIIGWRWKQPPSGPHQF